jgi:hypothetical protein
MVRARMKLSRPVARFSSVRSYRFVGGLPGIEAAGEIGDLAEAGAAKDACGDGAAIAAFAVDDEEPGGVELGGAFGELAERDAG